MKTSSNGRKLIESFEGLILHTYDDANDHKVMPGDPVHGVLTIGYGHTSSAGPPKVEAGQTISRELADQYLANDLGKVERDVERLVKVPLNQNQFDALVSFHFNTGALGRSSLLKRLNAKDYAGAAEGLMSWVNAKQIGPGPIPGLVRRREAEKALFLKPGSMVKPATTAIAPVIVGTAAAAHQWQEYLPYIIGGGMALAILTFIIIRKFKSNV